MFGYLILLFQLFLGGHFHMSLDGHPSHRNMGPLARVRDDLVGTKEGAEIVALPEWVWHYGHMVFIGDIMRFFKMSEHKRQDEYLRSGAKSSVAAPSRGTNGPKEIAFQSDALRELPWEVS